MPSREYYLQQARSCFDMATMARDLSVRDRWLARANEYLMLADSISSEAMPEPPLTGGENQAQPQQQQQQQAKEDDKE